MRPFLIYAVVRLGLWALLWWVLSLSGLGVVLAGVLAALIAMLLSILFLDRLRDAAAQRWKAADERRAERRSTEADGDAEYEDGLLDDAEESRPDENGADDGEDAEDGTVEDDAESDPAESSQAGDAESSDPASPAGLPTLDDRDEVTREDR